VALGISHNMHEETGTRLRELINPDSPADLIALMRSLTEILLGERNPSLAEDADIRPEEAAELLLLLEGLDTPSSPKETHKSKMSVVRRRISSFWRMITNPR
jgi:hypothetical protein